MSIKNTITALLISYIAFSCKQPESIANTDYYEITAENVAYYYDDADNPLVNTNEIKKMLSHPTTNVDWEFKEFKAVAPNNFEFYESKKGTYRINMGNLRIDDRAPGFSKINVKDITLQDLIFQDFSDFYYYNINENHIPTIASIIQHIKTDNLAGSVYYTDHKNYVIYGDGLDFNLIHIRYLKSLKKMEVFMSQQKAGPFTELSSRSLFSLMLSKLRMVINFHNQNNSTIEENWKHIGLTQDRYHRQIMNITFDFLKDIPKETPPEKKINIKLPEYELDIDLYRDRRMATVVNDLKKIKINDTINLNTPNSLHNPTKGFFNSRFDRSHIVVKDKSENILLLEDPTSKKVVFFYEVNKEPILLLIQEEIEDTHLYDNADMYFEMFKDFEKGFYDYY